MGILVVEEIKLSSVQIGITQTLGLLVRFAGIV